MKVAVFGAKDYDREFLAKANQPHGHALAFFDAHLAKWAALFFTDLEEAQSAVFYAPVGSLGRAFMAVEADAFAIQ